MKRVCELCKLFGMYNRDAKHLDVVFKQKLEHKYLPKDYVKMDLCQMHYQLNINNIDQRSRGGEDSAKMGDNS